jgi:antitoxin component YwqK of YwqJK toxin-antitoxin module
LNKIYILCALLVPMALSAADAEESAITSDQLVQKSGLRYEVGSETPYTGTVRDHYPNGQPIQEDSFVDGKAQGRQTKWYENGSKRSEKLLVDGKLDGLATVWYANGRKFTEWHYADGKLDGRSVEYRSDGYKRLEELHVAGTRRERIEYEYYEGGSLMAQTVWTNGDVRVETRWYENEHKQSEKRIVDDLRDGLSIRWDETGSKTSEANYLAGIQHGTATTWHSNGMKMSEGNFVNGGKDGLWTEWDETGRMSSEREYENGALMARVSE